ncbi:Imm45 family immunity protein [Aurantiacibacter aquimixticola]|uniref:Immunity protein 45 domain-containing protein n=1 Tax=Aurantiacibacter aquimixticola TaxID=1958945 RepID=A0A419RU43_9SPHN|nr:Imm45 family immunity protein [Aurantiacibacter aquimixticola]RJY09313.1 hypothetical protein D6201_08050 [Aurantiacibacter aquimixticola]
MIDRSVHNAMYNHAWKRLTDLSDHSTLHRGAVIRLKASLPYEEFVDFMVCENYDADLGMSLIVISGYKAGLNAVSLPKRSEIGKEGSIGYVNVAWLRENWNEWVYSDCSVEDVFVLETAPPAEAPPQISTKKTV